MPKRQNARKPPQSRTVKKPSQPKKISKAKKELLLRTNISALEQIGDDDDCNAENSNAEKESQLQIEEPEENLTDQQDVPTAQDAESSSVSSTLETDADLMYQEDEPLAQDAESLSPSNTLRSSPYSPGQRSLSPSSPESPSSDVPVRVGMIGVQVKRTGQQRKIVYIPADIVGMAQRKMSSAHVRFMKGKAARIEKGKLSAMLNPPDSTAVDKNKKKPEKSDHMRTGQPMNKGFNYCLEEEFGTDKILRHRYSHKNPGGKCNKIPLSEKDKDTIAAYSAHLFRYLRNKIAIGENYHLFNVVSDGTLYHNLSHNRAGAREKAKRKAMQQRENGNGILADNRSIPGVLTERNQ